MTQRSGMLAHGTQVYRKPDGTVVIVPPQVEYEPRAGETRISLVRNIEMSFPCDGAVTAVIDLFPSQDVVLHALPTYRLCGRDGKPRSVKFIEFENDERWFPEGGQLR